MQHHLIWFLLRNFFWCHYIEISLVLEMILNLTTVSKSNSNQVSMEGEVSQLDFDVYGHMQSPGHEEVPEAFGLTGFLGDWKSAGRLGEGWW